MPRAQTGFFPEIFERLSSHRQIPTGAPYNYYGNPARRDLDVARETLNKSFKRLAGVD
jgi:hypothetical protein